jgi:hypothetical protein
VPLPLLALQLDCRVLADNLLANHSLELLLLRTLVFGFDVDLVVS